MERQYACVCHLGDASIAAPSYVTHVHKEHLHKQRRKEKSRKKWESHKKASGRESTKSNHCGDFSVLRGKDAVDSMMTELQTLVNMPSFMTQRQRLQKCTNYLLPAFLEKHGTSNMPQQTSLCQSLTMLA